MTVIGAGVREVGVRDADGAFRAIDIAHRADVIDVLHAFEKSQRTSKRDLDPAAARFRQVVDR